MWGWLGLESSWGWAQREMGPQASSPVLGCQHEGSQAGARASGRTASSPVSVCRKAALTGWARRVRGRWASSRVSPMGSAASQGKRRVWVPAEPERVGGVRPWSVASWALASERVRARRESRRVQAWGWGSSHSRVGMQVDHWSKRAPGAAGGSVREPEAWQGARW